MKLYQNIWSAVIGECNGHTHDFDKGTDYLTVENAGLDYLRNGRSGRGEYN